MASLDQRFDILGNSIYPLKPGIEN
jgi:hypothetical protein